MNFGIRQKLGKVLVGDLGDTPLDDMSPQEVQIEQEKRFNRIANRALVIAGVVGLASAAVAVKVWSSKEEESEEFFEEDEEVVE